MKVFLLKILESDATQLRINNNPLNRPINQEINKAKEKDKNGSPKRLTFKHTGG